MSTSNAFATVEALRIVLREEQPPAMAEVLRDMERARMTAEDYRGAVLSPYPAGCNTADGHLRLRTWKEFGKERNQRCDHVTFNVIDPAKELLYDARREIVTALSGRKPNYKAAMNAAHDAMREVGRCLEDNSDTSESESES